MAGSGSMLALRRAQERAREEREEKRREEKRREREKSETGLVQLHPRGPSAEGLSLEARRSRHEAAELVDVDAAARVRVELLEPPLVLVELVVGELGADALRLEVVLLLLALDDLVQVRLQLGRHVLERRGSIRSVISIG